MIFTNTLFTIMVTLDNPSSGTQSPGGFIKKRILAYSGPITEFFFRKMIYCNQIPGSFLPKNHTFMRIISMLQIRIRFRVHFRNVDSSFFKCKMWYVPLVYIIRCKEYTFSVTLIRRFLSTLTWTFTETSMSDDDHTLLVDRTEMFE